MFRLKGLNLLFHTIFGFHFLFLKVSAVCRFSLRRQTPSNMCNEGLALSTLVLFPEYIPFIIRRHFQQKNFPNHFNLKTYSTISFTWHHCKLLNQFSKWLNITSSFIFKTSWVVELFLFFSFSITLYWRDEGICPAMYCFCRYWKETTNSNLNWYS